MSFVYSSAVIFAAKWIGGRLLEEGKYLYDVKDHVDGLQAELKYMLGLIKELDQAQQHGKEGDRQIVNYIKDIRQIAFDAEDVVDTYILQVASEMEGRSALTKCFCFLASTPLIHQTRNQIDSIKEKSKKANENLRTYSVGRTASSNNTTRDREGTLEKYGHTEDEIVVGFDKDIQTLVEQLTDANKKSRVIGIVGIGGAGKTTLAKKVFKHPHVTSYFKHKAWVSISQQWNRRHVLYEILRKTRGMTDESERNNRSVEELIEMIYDFLKEERYLLVLDDTWDTRAWDEIRDALPKHHKGSKIIITTEKLEVPQHADRDCFIFEPRPLDSKESWGLFREIAIGSRNAISTDIAEFEILGKEMAAKCGGLPLAVVTLAGLLRSLDSLDDWERITKACVYTILENKRANEIIALTYHNLPFHLKPCFLYLGLYPEDVEIKGTLLTQLWIAEGLITEDQRHGQEILEDVAKRYLDELVRRCILQVVRRNYTGIAKEFRLHDLLRVFCIERAKEQSFFYVFSSTDAKTSSLQARRATFHSGSSLPAQNSHPRSLIHHVDYSEAYYEKVLAQNSHLRSVIHHVDYSEAYYEKVRMSMNLIYKNCKLLRVLHLCNIETSSGKLSKEIGNLIHLRYLAIKGTNFKMFPKAIGNLRNLLTLDINHNRDVEKIAFSVSNMSQLRHLYLDHRGKILAKNFGLDKLKGLQIMKGIRAGNWMAKELYALSRDIKQVEIEEIHNMEQLEAVSNNMFDSFRTLKLHWSDADENLKLDLDKLENCHHLKKLRLWGRINGDNSVVKPLRFPPNIVSLKLHFCHLQGQDWITALGQLQHLKCLRLRAHSYEGTQLNIGASAFLRLQKLEFYGLYNLEEWRIEEGAFARLKELRIDACPKLQRLPQGLMTITTLEELSIGIMPATFCKRLGWQESDGRNITIRNSGDDSTEDGRSGEDFLFIQHVPTINIRCVREKLPFLD